MGFGTNSDLSFFSENEFLECKIGVSGSGGVGTSEGGGLVCEQKP